MLGLIKKCFITCLLVSQLLFASAKAQTVLFDQQPDPLGSLGAWNSSTQNLSNPPAPATGYRCYDDFTLNSAKYVFRATIRGFYADTALSSRQVTPNTFWWHIAIREDDGQGKPGQQVGEDYAFKASIAPAGRTPFLNHSYMTYDVTIDFKPIHLRGGKRYWLSVESLHLSGDVLFAWITSNRNTGVSWQYTTFNSTETLLGQRGDLAFRLIGDDAAVARCKVGLPEFGSKFMQHDIVRIPFYFKGAGNKIRNVRVRLLMDGVPVQFQEFEYPTNLVDDTWDRLLNFSIPIGTAIGVHTLEVVVEKPNRIVSTPLFIIYTGFDPAKHGWKFENYKYANVLNLTTYSGLCIGMSRLAGEYFSQRKPVPTGTDRPKRGTALYNELVSRHQSGSLRFQSTLRSRLARYADDNEARLTEANKIANAMFFGTPAAIICCGSRSRLAPIAGDIAHSVLGIATFLGDDFFDSNNPDQQTRISRFGIYDPNSVGEFCYLDVYETNLVFPGYSAYKHLVLYD